MGRYDKLNYINGKWTGSKLDKIEVFNPATGEAIGSIPHGGKDEANEAISSAARALPKWRNKTASERAIYLRRLFDLMNVHEEELAKLMTLEMGKPLNESRGEVRYAASFIEWFAEEGKRVYGRTIPGKSERHRIQVIKQPVGVVAAITPWNFPAAMITRKLGPALAAGCTFIVKPPKAAPLTAIKLMELCGEAGIPEGVVNLVCGSSSKITDAFMESDHVRKITFTGSTEVGRELMKKGADKIKNLSLELGGHAPSIVLDDADLDKAVQGIIASKFRNSGQTCICANRIYVQSGIYDEFVEKFSDEVKKLRVGNGLEEGVEVGPMIDQSGYEKVERHVQDALSRGATCVAGGHGTAENNTYFYQPTVLKNMNDDMLIMNEETFGPIAPIQRFDTDEEAIQLANNSPFGLASYFFTESVTRGTQIAEGLDYGIVGWNDGVPSAAQAPFGGMKQSGLGREGGIEGIEAYLETKYVSLGL